MARKVEKLTEKGIMAKQNFLAKLDVQKRKTKKPVIVAMVGLVGSGKSSVAELLSKKIGGTIIRGDDIRIELRKQGERYEQSRPIVEEAVLEILKQGGNVILDSDFLEKEKRITLTRKAQKLKTKVVFVRTYCDMDVAIGRSLTASYKDRVDDFFGGASSKWTGSAQTKGAAVKVREMWRRTPHHYRWVNQIGGRWILKKFSFSVFANIDTTDENEWQIEVAKCADRLLK